MHFHAKCEGQIYIDKTSTNTENDDFRSES